MRTFVASVAAVALATLAIEAARAGEITAHSFQSETLGEAYPYTIYLPDGYEDGALIYPVLYLLHGNGGDENSWIVDGRVQPTADRLIEEGMIPPTVIVMPGQGTTWWVDGNETAGETALIEDLVPHIEETYRVLDEREGRVVAGLSAGGYGTVNLALRHPDMFAAGAALSPAVYDPLPPDHSSGRRVAPFQVDGAFDPASWSRLLYTNYLDGYKAQDLVVPLYINTGDHDTFDIAYHAAMLYQRLRDHQPDDVEYRVIDGDHEWRVWQDTIGDAMVYMLDHVSRPVGAPVAAVAANAEAEEDGKESPDR